MSGLSKKKSSWTQTTVCWLPQGDGRWREKKVNGRINGDGRTLDLGWWTHNTIHRWRIVELYPWNLCNFINPCHPYFKNCWKLKKEAQNLAAVTKIQITLGRIILLQMICIPAAHILPQGVRFSSLAGKHLRLRAHPSPPIPSPLLVSGPCTACAR